MTDLPKTYDPAAVEPEANRVWTDEKLFHAEPTDPGDPYAIVIPPPNVTAALHLGHALNNTLQDILTRWRRMAGDNAIWLPGTDHAGIATQTVVEKRLRTEGKLKGPLKQSMDRDAFVAQVQSFKDDYEAQITDQLKLMGCSCDWDRQRFTMDPICAFTSAGSPPYWAGITTYSSSMIGISRFTIGRRTCLPRRSCARGSFGFTATAVSPSIVSGRVVATVT